MARRPAVTQADLTRCLKAALAAGVNAGRMEIEPGKVVVIFTTAPALPQDPNDLDAELERFEKEHGQD